MFDLCFGCRIAVPERDREALIDSGRVPLENLQFTLGKKGFCMRHMLGSLALAASVALLLTPGLRAQEKGKPAAEEFTGLTVGARAPKFVLKDQDGKDRSLDDMLKKGKVALVFYRSADW